MTKLDFFLMLSQSWLLCRQNIASHLKILLTKKQTLLLKAENDCLATVSANATSVYWKYFSTAFMVLKYRQSMSITTYQRPFDFDQSPSDELSSTLFGKDKRKKANQAADQWNQWLFFARISQRMLQKNSQNTYVSRWCATQLVIVTLCMIMHQFTDSHCWSCIA